MQARPLRFRLTRLLRAGGADDAKPRWTLPEAKMTTGGVRCPKMGPGFRKTMEYPIKMTIFSIKYDHLDVYFGDLSVLESLGTHFKKSPNGNQTDEKKR